MEGRGEAELTHNDAQLWIPVVLGFKHCQQYNQSRRTFRTCGNGKQQSVTVSGGSALSNDEIERMMADAQEHDNDYRKRDWAADVRHRADALARVVQRALAANADNCRRTSN